MRLREGDLVRIGFAYNLHSREATLEIEKRANPEKPPLALPLDESSVVGLIDNLSTVLTALRTGKPPVGWVDE